MLYDFYMYDVFSASPFAGNQLAVLPNAAGITAAGMQQIAREFNFVESTFVVPPVDPANTARVRIFTPKAEVDFAGHPTVGTACALVENGHVNGRDLVFEEGVGPIQVSVRGHGAGLAATLRNTTPITAPTQRPSPAELASVLSLDPADVVGGFFASVGLDFCFAQISSREAVDSAILDHQAWSEFARDAWSNNMFFFSGDPAGESPLYARMTAPAHDVAEDPATGSAIAALVAWFATETGADVNIEVLQGVAMGRPSEIAAAARVDGSGTVDVVEVGGPARRVASGKIEVDESMLA